MRRARELLAALMAAQAGGLLAQPPGLDGRHGLGIAGVSGVPRGRTWDAVGAARCPELVGDEVSFVVLDDGTIVVADDLPDESLVPLAEALERTLSPPYRAVAIRSEGTVWTAVGERVRIVELPGVDASEVDATYLGGARELVLDGVRGERDLPALDAIAGEQGDVALHAERIEGDVYAVDVYPL
ncbi:MAG: hypothetical protein RMM28_06190 [Thermoleophilia bacterium]|nr:hypothetical protein [Thermoleophilia bacterium]